MFGLLLGTEVLVVGIEDDRSDDGEPLLRVYIGARYLCQYVLVAEPEIERVRAAWGATSMGHLFMPVPPPDKIFQAVNLTKGWGRLHGDLP